MSPFNANPLARDLTAAIERAKQGDASQAPADAIVLASALEHRHAADVAFASMFGQGGHDLDVTDPVNPDGSCAHDYLCAYCNDAVTGSLVLETLEALLTAFPTDTHVDDVEAWAKARAGLTKLGMWDDSDFEGEDEPASDNLADRTEG